MSKTTSSHNLYPLFPLLPLFILYVLTAMPTIGWRDNSELAVTSWTLGIAHPAGMPTYSLLTKIFTFLPFGSIPWRITLAVGVFSITALWFLYQIIVTGMPGDDRANNYKSWAGAAITLVFGLGSTLWINSTQTEVYSLNLLFMAIILYCALRWTREDSLTWMYIGAFAYGLASGNHGSVAFYLPGLLAYFLLHSKNDTGRRFCLLLFFFLVGFSVYLYLPIRASANLTFDFGHPHTWDRLLMHLTDKKDASTHFAAAREGQQFFYYLWAFFTVTTPWYFWPLGLPLVVIGLWRFWKTDWPLALLLIYITTIDIVFFIKWTYDASNFFPAYLCLGILAGAGLPWLLARIPLWEHLKIIPMATLPLVFIGGVGLEYPNRDRSSAFSPLESFLGDYEALPMEAITVVGHQWFHQRAYQDIFRFREDVTVTLSSDFFSPELFNPVTQKRFPRAIVNGDPFKGADNGEMLLGFLQDNVTSGRPVYLEPMELTNEFLYPHLKPELTFLLRVTTEVVDGLSPEQGQTVLKQIRDKIAQEVEVEGFLKEPDQHLHYMSMLMKYAQYLLQQRRPEASVAIYRFLMEMFGPEGLGTMSPADQAQVNGEIGNILLNASHFAEAANRFLAAIALVPHEYTFWANLGQSYLKSGLLDQAQAALTRAIGLDAQAPEAFFNLGETLRKKGQPREAREYYLKALRVAKESRIRDLIKKSLKEMDSQPREAS